MSEAFESFHFENCTILSTNVNDFIMLNFIKCKIWLIFHKFKVSIIMHVEICRAELQPDNTWSENDD